MKGLARAALAALVAVKCIVQLDAFPSYSSRIPNSNKVELFGVVWSTLGHPQNGGGTSFGAANPFGKEVFTNDGAADLWSIICPIDSDEDGFSNGEELCDPGCIWTVGDPDPTDCRTDEVEGNTVGKPTHPGFQDGNNGNTVNLTLFHAALMLIAWLVLAPVGIILAMLYKKNNDPPVPWFKVHRIAMPSAVFLTVIGYLAQVGTIGFTLGSVHSQIGFSVVLLSIVQAISGIARPHVEKGIPKENKRLIWEFFHQWSGRIILFLAFYAAVTGVQIGYAESPFAYVIAVLFPIGALASFIYVLGFRDFPKEDETIQEFRKQQQPQYTSRQEQPEYTSRQPVPKSVYDFDDMKI